MSSRQLRKLRAAQEPADLSDSDSVVPVAPRKNLFSHFQNESEDSSSSSSEAAAPKPAPKKPKKRLVKKPVLPDDSDVEFEAALKEIEIVEPTEEPKNPDESNIFCLEKSQLNPSAEARRIFGQRAAPANQRLRRWLIVPETPEEVHAVGGLLKMELEDLCVRCEKAVSNKPSMACSCSIPLRGFSISPTVDYSASLASLSATLSLQDPTLLMRFAAKNPGHVHALLALTEIMKMHSQFSDAYKTVRVALAGLEKSFHGRFGCRGDLVHQRGSSCSFLLDKALHLYANLLAAQGCVATAMYVGIFSLGLDRFQDHCHWLLRLDTWAVRGKRWQMLEKLDSQGFESCVKPGNFKSPQLSMLLPNWAFSRALAAYAQLPSTDGLFEATGAVSETDLKYLFTAGNGSAAVLIVSAVLLFPSTVRSLLGPEPSDDWLSILAEISSIRSQKTPERLQASLGECYAEFAGPLWKADAIRRWLKIACARAIQLSAAHKNLRPTKKWSGVSEISDFLKRYADASAGEFKATDAVLPRWLREEDQSVNGDRSTRNFSPNISLDSHPAVVFLQSLLPWGRIDQTGAVVEPIRWNDEINYDDYVFSSDDQEDEVHME